ncbi:MAG: hypothetical protein K2F99_02450 [Muribaculaceae bacterium]|nr:hypothetical protein [Muribaculaceae bacterium]
MANALRAEITKEILDLCDDMDPTGKNTTRMRNFLSQKSDKEFMLFMDDFFSNPDKNIPIAYEAYNNPVTIGFIHQVAKKRKIPIYEIVYRPYVNGDVDDPPGTVNPIMVLVVPVKRLKQMAMAKNHTSTAAAKRDARTNQVTGEDRTARITDVEAYSLIVQGQYNAAQEYYGPMADDTEAHYEMLRRIQRDGEVELKDLPNDPLNKVTMNTINVYMLGSCIESNLIDRNGYLLPITLKGREVNKKAIDRNRTI